MKNIFLILSFILVLNSCKRKETFVKSELPSVVVTDTISEIEKAPIIIINPFEKKYDSLLLVNYQLQKERDSLNELNHKVAQDLLQNKLIIKNAQYYLNITIKNPSQDKFLKGWMRRALNQETAK